MNRPNRRWGVSAALVLLTVGASCTTNGSGSSTSSNTGGGNTGGGNTGGGNTGGGSSATTSSAATSANSTGAASSPATSNATSTAAATSGGTTPATTAATTATGSSGGSSGANSSGPPPNTDGGVWVDVTPSNVVLADTSSGCGNYGVQTVGVDPSNPANLYASWNCQGIWKSTDYGQTWNGPLNNSVLSAGAGGVTVARGSAGDAGPPVLYVSNIRGATGFWVSLDDGVTWTNDDIAPAAAGRQDVYPPAVDPYDPNHLIMAGHEQDLLVESANGGQTWTNVNIATDGGALTGAGMYENGGTAAIFFIDTGVPSTTRTSFLWMAQATGGTIGTWITGNDGASWTQVDENEHGHGASQIYQPGGGVVYMAGDYSALGWGVLRSADYGQTWTHVGATGSENEVFGTPNDIYATWGWACVPTCGNLISLQVASQPGTGTWASVDTPNAMNVGGGAAQAAVTFDGAHYVILLGAWDDGLWRYVEP